MSLYGDTALIGAHLDDDNGINTGKVYVFKKPPQSPPPMPPPYSPHLYSCERMLEDTGVKIYANDAASSDYFGTSVSLYGDTALISAHGGDDKGSNTGKVYVFTRSRVHEWPPPSFTSPIFFILDHEWRHEHKQWKISNLDCGRGRLWQWRIYRIFQWRYTS